MSTTSYTITVSDVIDAALRKIGVIIQGDTATDDQASEAMMALNVMVGRFFTLGMPFYREVEFSITSLESGTASYDLTNSGDTSGGLYNIYYAEYFNTDTQIGIPIRVISREEYYALTNRSTGGTPVTICIMPDALSCYLWPIPDDTAASNHYINMWGYRNEVEYTSITDDVVFPREWGEALIYGLALRLAPEYGAALDVTNSLKAEYRDALKDAVDWNPEMNSTYFGVSQYGRK